MIDDEQIIASLSPDAARHYFNTHASKYICHVYMSERHDLEMYKYPAYMNSLKIVKKLCNQFEFLDKRIAEFSVFEEEVAIDFFGDITWEITRSSLDFIAKIYKIDRSVMGWAGGIYDESFDD